MLPAFDPAEVQIVGNLLNRLLFLRDQLGVGVDGLAYAPLVGGVADNVINQ